MAVPTAPKLIMLTVATTLMFITMFSRSCLAGNILLNGEILNAGQSLEVGSYKFILRRDCVLELLDLEHRASIWRSTTDGATLGRNGCKAVLQNDGNLVVYEPADILSSTTDNLQDKEVVWSSKSNGAKGKYVLVLQEDRNIVIYGSDIWSTGTYIRTINGVSVTSMNGSQNATTIVGQVEVAAAAAAA